jgi:hypothetical protein
MSDAAKKTTVDASQFEQVVAALMIVGKAELAEIMEASKKPRVGTTRGHSRAPRPYDQRHEGHKRELSSAP